MDFNCFPNHYFLVFFPVDYFGDPVGEFGLTEITTGMFGLLGSTVSLTGAGLKEITTGLYTEKFLV